MYNNAIIQYSIFDNTLLFLYLKLGIGDWGLGIGQSPIPNPQSPINNLLDLVI